MAFKRAKKFSKFLIKECPRILILCEGETEKGYFNAIKNKYRLSGVEILLDGQQPAVIVFDSINIKLAISNPEFEFWLLCHFEQCLRVLKKKDLQSSLRKYCPDFEKSEKAGSSFFNNHSSKIQKAIFNADKILTEQQKIFSDSATQNPSTSVQNLVKELLPSP